MKRIIKGTEPAAFSRWKEQANADWTPVYPDLQNPEKRDLHRSLLQEQNFFCCYCGQTIALDSSHIEHFRPQEHYPEQALEYANLHASCLRETKPGNPLHCGHRKGNWFDEHAFIAPTEETCEQRFRYLLTGGIQPTKSEDSAASTMIEVLALDIAYLNQRRNEAIGSFFDDEFIMHTNDQELMEIITALRTAPAEKQVTFGHVLARYAEQLISPVKPHP